MVRITYANSAVHDLKSIHNYIATGSLLYAKKFIALLRQHITVLKKHPQIGQPFHADKFKNLRQVLVRSYRIIYHFEGDVVTILAIQHQSRLTDQIVSLDTFKK